MRIHPGKLGGAGAILLALLLAACDVATDRSRYEAGESGVVTFRNSQHLTVYLAGCAHFDYQKRVAGEWIPQGSDIQCVWEGFAQPVPRGEEVVEAFFAREPGVWRLRYAVGLGCSASEPLSQCTQIHEVASNEFEVVDAN